MPSRAVFVVLIGILGHVLGPAYGAILQPENARAFEERGSEGTIAAALFGILLLGMLSHATTAVTRPPPARPRIGRWIASTRGPSRFTRADSRPQEVVGQHYDESATFLRAHTTSWRTHPYYKAGVSSRANDDR